MCLWLVPRVRSLGGGTLCCKGLPGLTSWWINFNFLIPDVWFLAAKYAGFPCFTLKHRIYFSSVFCVITCYQEGKVWGNSSSESLVILSGPSSLHYYKARGDSWLTRVWSTSHSSPQTSPVSRDFAYGVCQEARLHRALSGVDTVVY